MTMKSYIEFKELETKTKTKKFDVVSKTDGSKLGEIKWHGPYRSYALFVTSEINYDSFLLHISVDTKIFDTKCQREITAFIENLMEERKNERIKIQR